MGAVATTVLGVFLRVASMAPSRISPATVPGFFSDAVEVVASLDGTVDELDVLATMGTCEGAGRADVVGDSGAAIGAWQLHAEHFRGHARDEVAADRKLQAMLWLLSFRELRVRCGSDEAAIGAIATGRCGGAPKLSRRRLRGAC